VSSDITDITLRSNQLAREAFGDHAGATKEGRKVICRNLILQLSGVRHHDTQSADTLSQRSHGRTWPTHSGISKSVQYRRHYTADIPTYDPEWRKILRIAAQTK